MIKKQKAHSLTGRITLELMLLAFHSVKRNRGAAGIDKVSVAMFEANLLDNLIALMDDLKKGTFEPYPLRRAYIPKNATEFRPLGIPAVRDRIAQEVVRRLLEPLFEPLFHPSSYGFRPGRNCHQAVESALELHRAGHLVILDADIKKFFDMIPHHVIMEAIANEVADGNILRLIDQFLSSGVMEDGVFKPTTVGTPQGGVISPLLANITLNAFDWQLDQAGYRFIRYADDFVVLCQSQAEAKEALDLVTHILKNLELHLSPEKTHITTYGKGYSFLGFQISSRSVRMRPKSVEKLKEKVRDITRRCHNFDAQIVGKLNQVIRGTANYFATAFSHCQWQFHHLDQWIRMRLRCMRYKRKSRHDNWRMRQKYFRCLGLLEFSAFC